MTVGWVGSGLTGNSKREMNLRTTVLHASVPFFVFGLLLSFFQLSSLAISRGGRAGLAFGSWADDEQTGS